MVESPARPRIHQLSGLPLEMQTPRGTWLPLMVMPRDGKKIDPNTGKAVVTEWGKDANGKNKPLKFEWETTYSNYLQVAHRLVWFREDHPDGRIETKMEMHDPQNRLCLFRAWVYAAGGVLLASAVKQEAASDFGDYIEKAETGSIGRALALCGYGTQFAPEFDEGQRLADAPTATANNDARAAAAKDAPKGPPPRTAPPSAPAPGPGPAPTGNEEGADGVRVEPLLMSAESRAVIVGLTEAKLGFAITDEKNAEQWRELRETIATSLGVELKPIKRWTEADARAIVDHLEGLPNAKDDDDPHGLWNDDDGRGDLPGDDDAPEKAPPPARGSSSVPAAAATASGSRTSSTSARPKLTGRKDNATMERDEKRLVTAAVLSAHWVAETREVIMPSALMQKNKWTIDRYNVSLLAGGNHVDEIVVALEQAAKQGN